MINKFIYIGLNLLPLFFGIKEAFSEQIDVNDLELQIIPNSDLVISKESTDSNVKIGGISGAIFIAEDGILRTISDEKSIHPKGYDFKIITLPHQQNKFKINFIKEYELIDNQGFQLFDCEDIVFDRLGNQYIATEGGFDKSIHANTEAGVFIAEPYNKEASKFQLNSKISIDKNIYQEIKGNFGFESLAYDYNTKEKVETLITANESALKRDDTEADFTKGSLVRILKFRKTPIDKEFIKVKEFAYEVSKIPPADKKRENEIAVKLSGLVDILELGNDKYLTLERSAIIYQTLKHTTNGSVERTLDKNDFFIKIYEIDLANGLDVSNEVKLSSISKDKILKKKLILDLSSPDVLKHISSTGYNGQKLDNMESISYGPILKNGNKTIMLISDDNFSNLQRNIILFFEMKK